MPDNVSDRLEMSIMTLRPRPNLRSGSQLRQTKKAALSPFNLVVPDWMYFSTVERGVCLPSYLGTVSANYADLGRVTDGGNHPLLETL